MFGQVTLRWNPNAEADLAGYYVLYGTSAGTYPYTVDVVLTATPTAPSVTLTSFQVYGLLFFVVKAYDTSGNISSESAEVSHAVAPVLRPMQWP